LDEQTGVADGKAFYARRLRGRRRRSETGENGFMVPLKPRPVWQRRQAQDAFLSAGVADRMGRFVACCRRRLLLRSFLQPVKTGSLVTHFLKIGYDFPKFPPQHLLPPRFELEFAYLVRNCLRHTGSMQHRPGADSASILQR
jgi:hypothetical protein